MADHDPPTGPREAECRMGRAKRNPSTAGSEDDGFRKELNPSYGLPSGPAQTIAGPIPAEIGDDPLIVMAGLRPGHPHLCSIEKARRGCPRQAPA
jgi:hypothetical protein